MAKLVLSMDGLVLKEVELSKQRISIGRKPSNDIQIENLAISGEHAAIVTVLNDSFLEDLDSTNGTLVNGQPVKKVVLQSGDIIELGKYKLKFFNEKPQPGDPSGYGEPLTVTGSEGAAAAGRGTESAFMRSQATSSQVAGSPTAATAGPASGSGGAYLQVLNGNNNGRRLDLEKEKTTLGKPGVQVVWVVREPGGYAIQYVEGPHRPLVNDSPVTAPRQMLANGDIIEIATVRMAFHSSVTGSSS